MTRADTLLIAPTVFCAIGTLIGAFVDVTLSRVCVLVAAASAAALILHWLIGRAKRRTRSCQWEPAASTRPAPDADAADM